MRHKSGKNVVKLFIISGFDSDRFGLSYLLGFVGLVKGFPTT